MDTGEKPYEQLHVGRYGAANQAKKELGHGGVVGEDVATSTYEKAEEKHMYLGVEVVVGSVFQALWFGQCCGAGAG